MPAEWAEHSCCWMAWPCREGFWGNAEATQRTYADVANTIARFEPVKMLAPAHKLESARVLLNEGVEIIEMSIDDSWARDSGPNFLVNEAGEIAGSTWVFNAWGGKYDPYDQDALMGTRILELAGVREYPSKLVAEGGGVTVDGEGTVITTETCFLNQNRNPNWTRAEVEAELCRTLGAEKVIWIPGDVTDTETDGHVDGIAAFIEPGRVLVEVNSDKTDPHYEIGQINLAALKNQRDARGRVLQLEFIEEGIYHPGVWNGGCSSYVNSYLANGAVIISGYGYDRDGAAIETYRELYPDREVIQVQIHDIAIGGGGVHCITQQQPAPIA
ncbi:MAG: agmatine deiminase family protein [Deltaproteobacteria bacterium]|nr:agmatine deiminase family protein [Deltaproteobacteria bacterium]